MDSLYTNEVTACLKPAGVSLVFIHQQLEDNANQCVYSITQMSKLICIIMKIDQNISLTVQTSFVYFLRKIILGFYNN